MASPQVLFSVWHPGDGGEDSGHTQTVTLHRSAKAPGKQTPQPGKQRAEAGLDRGTSFCSFWCRRGCSDDPLNSRERSKFEKYLLFENSPLSDHGSGKVSGAPQALIGRAAEKPGPALSPWRRSRHTEAEDLRAPGCTAEAFSPGQLCVSGLRIRVAKRSFFSSGRAGVPCSPLLLRGHTPQGGL